MCPKAQMKAAMAAGLLAFSLPSLSNDSFTFTFSPPPITKADSISKPVNKGSVGYTSIENDAGAATTEFELLNANYLNKHKGKFFSFGVLSGEDDSGVNYLLGLNGQAGVERDLGNGLLSSASVGLNYIYLEADGGNVFYSETYLYTVPANLSVQKRFPVDEQVGVTPFVSLNAILFGTGTTDFNNSGGVGSNDFDVDPSVGIQLGLDVDFMGYSLAGYYQSTSDNTVTSLNFSKEF